LYHTNVHELPTTEPWIVDPQYKKHLISNRINWATASGDFAFADSIGQNGANVQDTSQCDNVLVSRESRGTRANLEASIPRKAGTASVELSQKPAHAQHGPVQPIQNNHAFWGDICSPEVRMGAQGSS